MKVLYEEGENYYTDIKEKKKEGWKPVTKPNFYDESWDMVIKSSSNGFVITFIKYERI